MEEATANLSIMGFDFEAKIYFEITVCGSEPVIDYNNGGDPGWPTEWNIISITLTRDDIEIDEPPEFDATGAFLESLCQTSAIRDAVDDRAAELEIDQHCRRLRRRA